MSSTSDHATALKIRDAAIGLFGEQGVETTTVRQIAERAGVPVGLVNYHFGSKDGLRLECDRWVIQWLRDEQWLTLVGGSLPQLQAYLADHPQAQPMMNYLVMCLRSGGDVATHVFDDMVRVTRDLLIEGAKHGKMREVSDLDASAALLVAYGCGAGLFGDHIARNLGGTAIFADTVYPRYANAAIELFNRGLVLSPGNDDPDPGQPQSTDSPQQERDVQRD